MNAKRLATVLLLVVALAAASTALAQAQRWEYAIFTSSHTWRGGNLELTLLFQAPGMFIVEVDTEPFLEQLRVHYGAVDSGFWFIEALNLIGRGGWELVLLDEERREETQTRSSRYMFKRPLRE